MALARRGGAAGAGALSPMLATIGRELPGGAHWVFEPKYDGIRVLAYATPAAAALISRNGLEKTRQFPEVAEALITMAKARRRPFVVDGEIVALDPATGEPARFQRLQSRMHVTDARAIASHRDDAPAALMVFDILMDGARSVADLSLGERRAALESFFAGASARRGSRPPSSVPIRLSPQSRDGARILDEARAAGWEGVMAKDERSRYSPGVRSREWLKIKLEQQQEFVVGGYTEPRNSREHIGAILLGYHDRDGRLIYAGHTGGGFSRASLTDMYRRLRPLARSSSPFTTSPKTNERPHWVRPRVVVQVRFNEWTTDGKLRQPIFLGVRDDKDPGEVVRESPALTAREADAMTATKRASTARKQAGSKTKAAPPRKAASAPKRARKSADLDAIIERLDAIEHEERGSGELELPTGTLALSNLGKVFFPATKQTKGDLMRYYVRVSPYLLPAIEGRALVMKRFPNGIRGQAFYQQKAPPNPPPAVRVEEVEDEGIETQKRLIGGDLATLLYLVQLGAISVDPWHSRAQSVTYADYSIIDLDPGPRTSFARVIDAARWAKDVLDELGLHAIAKTSGASGLHVVLPLAPRTTNEGARTAAELVATRVAEDHPKAATVLRWVKSRPATSVYMDYLQNIRGKTVAGVYSARAEPKATVSTPLEWKEVAPGLDPRDFTIANVPERIESVGDLWGEGMKKKNSLRVLEDV